MTSDDRELGDASDGSLDVLTPDYNADHRNHFHVDLTEGADTIK